MCPLGRILFCKQWHQEGLHSSQDLINVSAMFNKMPLIGQYQSRYTCVRSISRN